MYRKVRELSGNFSVCSKVWLVNLPLCEQPAGQNLEKSYPHPPSQVEFGLGSPLAVLEKNMQLRYEFIKDYVVRTIALFQNLYFSVLDLLSCYELRLKIVYCCYNCVWEFCIWSLFCCAVLKVLSSFEAIRKREMASRL